MKNLQQEFISIDESLKASLQQRMKFEIAERIVSDSRQFLFLRLFMIDQFHKKVESIKSKNPDNPVLLKLTPLSVG